MPINNSIIPGGTAAINEALSRRGLGNPTPALDQKSGGSPFSMGITPPTPTEPTRSAIPQGTAQPRKQQPMDEASIIVRTLGDRLKKLPAGTQV